MNGVKKSNGTSKVNRREYNVGLKLKENYWLLSKHKNDINYKKNKSNWKMMLNE